MREVLRGEEEEEERVGMVVGGRRLVGLCASGWEMVGITMGGAEGGTSGDAVEEGRVEGGGAG